MMNEPNCDIECQYGMCREYPGCGGCCKCMGGCIVEYENGIIAAMKAETNDKDTQEI
jgi:hypothetical protein